MQTPKLGVSSSVGVTSMRATLSPILDRRRPTGRRGRHAPARSAARTAVAGPEQRVREAGGPLDLAHYTCGCGLAFEAAVSASVTCPHCGSGQAW